MTDCIDKLLDALTDYYINSNANNRPIEYSYGFFDAMSVIRQANQKDTLCDIIRESMKGGQEYCA